MQSENQNGYPQGPPVNPTRFDSPKPQHSVVSKPPEQGIVPGLPCGKGDPSGLRILKLPPHTVGHHADNPEITLAEVTGLLASMRQDGQLQPSMVYPDPDRPGQWVCGIGNHRLYCCRVLNTDFLAYALDQPVSRQEMRRLRLTENTFRQTMTPIKIGEELFAHIQETGDTDEAAAEFFRLSTGYVSKLLAPFRRGIPELQQALKDGSIVAGGGPFIAALPPEVQVRAIGLCIGKKRDTIVSTCRELRDRKPRGEKPLKLRRNGIDLTVRQPTPEGIQAFLDAVAGALRKLAKDRLPMTVLPDLLR